MSSKRLSTVPKIGSRPPVLSTTFDIESSPAIYAKDDTEKKWPFWPRRAVVEQRVRGTRIQVFSRSNNGLPRTVNFNVHGYPYQQAPEWLMDLWSQASNQLGLSLRGK